MDGRSSTVTPARWLYQSRAYLSERQHAAKAGLALLRLPRPLGPAGGGHERSPPRELTVVRDRIRDAYGIGLGRTRLRLPSSLVGRRNRSMTSSPVLPLRLAAAPVQERRCCCGRVFRWRKGEARDRRGGTEESRLRAVAGPRVSLVGSVTDDQLRWLYGSCRRDSRFL
jgi:hypothetical protein